jgi:hypothetical protein
MQSLLIIWTLPLMSCPVMEQEGVLRKPSAFRHNAPSLLGWLCRAMVLELSETAFTGK